MSSTYGEILKLSIFGQSHGPAIGMTLDGIPAGLPVDTDALQRFLARRAPGHNAYSTPRKEPDVPEFLAGIVAFRDVYDRGGSTKEAILASGGKVNSIYAISAANVRKSMGDTDEIDLYTIGIGDIAFIGAEYEMFDTNGVFIKENSPYEMTFVLCYCNDGHSYIPSAIGFELGCYESDTSYYEAGTGELLANEYVRILNELYSGK